MIAALLLCKQRVDLDLDLLGERHSHRKRLQAQAAKDN